jgi:hypothetical protein
MGGAHATYYYYDENWRLIAGATPSERTFFEVYRLDPITDIQSGRYELEFFVLECLDQWRTCGQAGSALMIIVLIIILMAQNQVRHFSQKLLNSPRNTVKVIPTTFKGERLDKFLMAHFKLPWTAAHRLVRSKKVFVVKDTWGKPTTPPPDGQEDLSRFVYRDSAYKIAVGDQLCFPKDVGKELEKMESGEEGLVPPR